MNPRDYREIANAISTDLMLFIESYPDAIEVLVFKPVSDSAETTAVDTDVVGSIENEERAVEFQDPVMRKAVKIPDQYPFGGVDAGGWEPDGNSDQPIVMLINDAEIPKQTVVQYQEYINQTDKRTVSLYVLRSEIVGEAPGVVQKHYCLPFQVFDYEFIEPPMNDEPDDEAEDIGETPTLTATEFVLHCNEDDTHGKSQWQIRTESGDYTRPYYDSGACTDLRSHVVLAGTLIEGSIYFWHVRYRGTAGDEDGEEAVWSDWSTETSFRTAEVFE